MTAAVKTTVEVGDVFKCKRRGHKVVVSAFVGGSEGREVRVLSGFEHGVGRMVKCKTARLLMPYRFEHLPGEKFPAEPKAEPKHAPGVCGQCDQTLDKEPCTS